VREHLGVALRPEAVARGLELAAELAVVVELAVLDDGDAPVLVRQGLVAGLEVDDREPSRGEPDGPVEGHAVAIRPAVDERRAHRAEPRRVDVADGRGDPADPTHGG
jgi:hypothetical protein